MALIFSLDQGRAGKAEFRDLGDGIFLKGQNGRAVILIHGLTGTPNEMKSLGISLNRKGYTVVCPRLKNHGAPLDVLKDMTWEDFYQSVKEAYMKVKDDHEFIAVSGLSMGALLALVLADEFPEKIKGVSCLSPTLFYDGWNTPWYNFFFPLATHTPLRNFFYHKEDPPYGVKNKEMQKRLHNYYSTAVISDTSKIAEYGYPYFPVVLLCQLKALVRHVTARLKDITVPVQLIQAKDDDISSVKNSQFIYDGVGSKTKEIVMLYDSYHCITADQERKTVTARVEEFFEKIHNGDAK
ncbi:MAG: alpha/beta fold hydrolase [Candidatus Omnitrophica bacterium]|nr:alpha/beta fold hydrolase [Candidatus Omnitrophota bacterium]MDD5310512.1 alpha/beta fold hydrolase [Candidatus Omnitrophota bacterium]MDD5546062.1 alpha/beta fold hydrolase [Candidatus Omnitrophota bacterium]